MTTDTDTLALMYAVLDGEADAAEARRLDALLAADTGARATYGELQRLYAALERLPERHPPEGLVAAVLSAAARRTPRDAGDDADQLFPAPRVFGSTVTSTTKEDPMSDRTAIFASRKAWIGAGVAAAALLVVTQYGFDLVPREQDVLGTVAPAQRHRAPQATAEDIKLGPQSGSGQASTSAVPAQGQAADVRANAAAADMRANAAAADMRANAAAADVRANAAAADVRANAAAADLRANAAAADLRANAAAADLRANAAAADARANAATADVRANAAAADVRANAATSNVRANAATSDLRANSAAADARAQATSR